MAKKRNELRLPAIEVRQSPGRRLYTFAVDGKLLPSVAAISRIRRTAEDGIAGYQRPEVVSHIGEIRAYLESEAPMLPNAVVLAFDSRVRFVADRGGRSSTDYSRTGSLVIPLNDDWGEAEKPGFVVDGQQRLAAIREAGVDRFPVCVTAFITDEVSEQTEQFILVNSTKPLPKGLIYELLPSTQARLPTILQRRRFPALLLERLNHDVGPLRGRIRTPTNPEGTIKDNSVLRMLENSLTDGVLYRYRAADSSGDGVDRMLSLLNNFWTAVGQVFPDAWEKPPKQSRLVHGAGVVSMGFVMDAIADRHRRCPLPSSRQFKADLEPLAEVCRWTDGYWDFGPGMQRKWNEIQNTSKDIQLLANYLLLEYKDRVWSRRSQSTGASQRLLPI